MCSTAASIEDKKNLRGKKQQQQVRRLLLNKKQVKP